MTVTDSRPGIRKDFWRAPLLACYISVTGIAVVWPLTVQGDDSQRVRVSLSTTIETGIRQIPANRSSGDFTGSRKAAPARCSTAVPESAKPLDSLALCRSDHSGKNEAYACQNFTTFDANYRVFFKGGRLPRAVARVAEHGDDSKMLWTENERTGQPVCNFPSPVQIPAEARFLGAGICLDGANRNVPCTVFRHQAARSKSIVDYLIFYKLDGSGPEYMLPIYIGENIDAMTAELAFQIGIGLLNTRCCKRSGLQYIKYAHRLFPDSVLYHAVYQHYKQQASSNLLADHLFANNYEMR